MGYSLCMLRGGAAISTATTGIPTCWRSGGNLTTAASSRTSGSPATRRNLGDCHSPEADAAIRCVASGFELSPPPLDAYAEAFAAVCADLGVDADDIVAVPQVEVDGRRVDTVDRIQLGADIVRRLVAAGL